MDLDVDILHEDYQQVVPSIFEALLADYPACRLRHVELYNSSSNDRSLASADTPGTIKLNSYWFRDRPLEELRQEARTDYLVTLPRTDVTLRWHGGMVEPVHVLVHEFFHVLGDTIPGMKEWAQKQWEATTEHPETAVSGYSLAGPDEWWAEACAASWLRVDHPQARAAGEFLMSSGIRADASWEEGKHPRGQPGNPGQFASKPGGGTSASEPAEGPTPQEAKTLAQGARHLKQVLSRAAKGNGKVVPREKQHESNIGIYEHLNHLTAVFKPKVGDHPASFIMKHGQPFVANEKTYAGKRGPMKMCYMNATQEVLNNPDRTYVEGYITVYGIPIAHAWTVDKTGQIYDPTINPDVNISGYFGVPFNTEYVLKAALKNKVYGLLGHGSKTLPELMEGKEPDFKASMDSSLLSDDHIADRLAFADKMCRLLPPTDDISTPERAVLREHIANTLYDRDIGKRARNREATIILGLPGAGKSVFAKPLLESGALEIDNDNAKEMLPEFHGGVGAFSVHNEAGDIARNVLKRAIDNGDNFIWPRVDSPETVKQDIETLKKAGYKVHLKMVKVTHDVAVESVVNRYLNTGRYVSPDVVAEYGNSPDEAFEQAKELADDHEVATRGRVGGFTFASEQSGVNQEREGVARAA